MSFGKRTHHIYVNEEILTILEQLRKRKQIFNSLVIEIVSICIKYKHTRDVGSTDFVTRGHVAIGGRVTNFLGCDEYGQSGADATRGQSGSDVIFQKMIRVSDGAELDLHDFGVYSGYHEEPLKSIDTCW